MTLGRSEWHILPAGRSRVERANHFDNLPHLWQGGLGMPDRDSYLDTSPKMAELRAAYQSHIAGILKLAGITDPENVTARQAAVPGWRKTRRRDGRGWRSRSSSRAGPAATRKGSDRRTHVQK